MSLRGPAMVDVTLWISNLRGAWQVILLSPEGHDKTLVAPLTDADLRGVPELPVARWQDLVERLRPGRGLDAQHLQLLGELLMGRLLQETKLRLHLQRLYERQRQRREPLRFLLETEEEGDALLADLPLELLHDGEGFVFRRAERPALRSVPLGSSCNLRLTRGAMALLVTAHADDPPHPDQAELAAHVQKLQAALHAAGYASRVLAEATKEGLRQALLAEPVDILYVACHGQENHREAGSLRLRDGLLNGLTLKEWLLEAGWQHQRPVQVVLLSACSSAVPQAERGTSGMAQKLVETGAALAALGYRGPVAVAWALQLSERLFRYLGAGHALEDAFARARCDAEVRDPQWALPLLYGRPQDLNALLALAPEARTLAVTTPLPGVESWSPHVPFGKPVSLAGEGALRSLLPRAPRPFFTGRVAVRAELERWLRQPGTAQLVGLAGGGGIGKTELACYVAHERRAAGWPVLFLESPERDLRGAAAKLIQAAQPDFALKPEHTQEALGQRLRDALAPHRGLLVLDDVSDDRAVQALLPGGGWNVLSTSRAQGLVPGVTAIGVGPMKSAEAQELFCQVAYEQKAPPPWEDGAAVAQLVQRLGGVPLALELSAAALRREGLGAAEYLAQWQQGEGAAAQAQGEVQRVLLRSLAKLPEEDGRVFCGLGILPAAGVGLREVAVAVGEGETEVLRRLGRLQRYHLVEVAQGGVYGLHPLQREAARAKAKEAGWWDALHLGTAKAMDGLWRWVMGELGSRVDQRSLRWRQVREQFDSLELRGWLDGAPGGALVATVLAFADQPRSKSWIPRDRDRELAHAMALLPANRYKWRQTQVLFARGTLRNQTGDLDAAREDFDLALALSLATGDGRAQAHVLCQRGDVRRKCGDILGASEDLQAALELFLALNDRQGQSKVLFTRGVLRRHQGDLEGARANLDTALPLFRETGNCLGQALDFKMRGDLAGARRDWAEAERCYLEAIRLYEAEEYTNGLAPIYLGLAAATVGLYELELAKQRIQQAIHWAAVSGDPSLQKSAEEVRTLISELLAQSSSSDPSGSSDPSQ